MTATDPDGPDRRTLDDAPEEVVPASEVSWDVGTDVLVAGAGGCGLVAGLAASEDPDLTVTLLEKSDEPGGNTALSTGQIPAAPTRFQEAAGIDDSAAAMARDILEKNDHEADEDAVARLAEESADLIHWLADDLGVTLRLVDDFRYPGMSEYRMHAPPGNNGERLVEELVERLEARPNVELLTNSPVRRLVEEDGAVAGAVAGERRTEAIEADAVILATDGFGGNKAMVAEHCDEAMTDAVYFGSDGNTGDGIRWGAAFGGRLAYMDAYQGHATVTQEGALSTYAVVMNGGILLDVHGERFGDETVGYSGFALSVLEQPDGVAYEFFDERIFERLRGQFDDFDEAVELGSYRRGETVEAVAETLGCDPENARRSVEAYNEAARAGGPDEVGREESLHPLEAPFYGAKVTGSLFHTQGGLVVDEHARVLREDGSVVEGLYAGGGVARGVSGHGPDGYLAGNGLTAALGYGRLAGIHARGSLGSR